MVYIYTLDWKHGQEGISNYLIVYEEFDDLELGNVES